MTITNRSTIAKKQAGGENVLSQGAVICLNGNITMVRVQGKNEIRVRLFSGANLDSPGKRSCSRVDQTVQERIKEKKATVHQPIRTRKSVLTDSVNTGQVTALSKLVSKGSLHGGVQ